MVKDNYDNGYWSKQRVHDVVGKLITMSASNNGIRKEDGLYVPVHQYKIYKKEQYTQGLLFGETA